MMRNERKKKKVTNILSHDWKYNVNEKEQQEEEKYIKNFVVM